MTRVLDVEDEVLDVDVDDEVRDVRT